MTANVQPGGEPTARQANGVPPDSAPDSGPSGTKTLIALSAAVFGYALMQTVVVPALRLLERELDTTPTWSAWILSAFLLSSAVLTPLLGRLGDLYGKRQVMIAVLIAYAVGMVAASASQNIGQLIAARVIQGAALSVVPLSMAILREALPRERLPFAMGLVSGIVGAGAGAGLVIGGLLADYLSWRYLFVLGALLAVISLLLVLRWVRASRHTATGGLDIPGAVLLGLSLVAVLLALTQGPSWGWTSVPVLGLFVLGVLLFAALMAVERRKSDALIDVSELTDRPMTVTHLAALLFGAASYFFYLGMPLFAQQQPSSGGVGFGASVTMAGLLMLPGMLAIIPASMAVGRIATAYGPRWPLAGGFVLFTVGSVLLASAHAAEWEHLVFYAIVGAGSGLIMGALPKLIADIVPLTRTGTANGINNIARTGGSVIGSQLAAAVMASSVVSRAAGVPDSAFTTLFWLGAIAAVLGVVISPLAVRRAAATTAPNAPQPAEQELQR
ncbi:MFS transporter [Streptosporangium sp. NBC_01639]|uniref:MFS transporter n=1 Tax=Streptosporangium sp. NBC_01639 TaxID=2975948 RepID=UPI00386EBB2C|nr:MFS transporter [Streptosporangium sp. NBC_01639]